MKKRSSHLLVPVFLLVSTPAAYGGDAEEPTVKWLHDFFEKGIKSANAEYTYQLESPEAISDHYRKEARITIAYNFAEKIYQYQYNFEYRDFWSVLTAAGNGQPPRQEVRFTGSSIQPWTNESGLGVYRETYERTLPNWLNFDKLDSLMLWQAVLNNPRPPLSGLFLSDEIKALKKLYRESSEKPELAELLACFEFDRDGNLQELSRFWLDECRAEEALRKKRIAENAVVIRNAEDDVLFLEILSHNSKYGLIEGVKFTWNRKSCKVFSFELNAMLHKFVPDLISDPDTLILNYLKELNRHLNKSLSRFELVTSN